MVLRGPICFTKSIGPWSRFEPAILAPLELAGFRSPDLVVLLTFPEEPIYPRLHFSAHLHVL